MCRRMIRLAGLSAFATTSLAMRAILGFAAHFPYH